MLKLKKRGSHFEEKKKSELSFSDIDEPLRQFLAKSFVWLGVAFVIIIMTGIIFKQTEFFLFGSLVILILVMYILSIISKALNKKIYYYDGICSEIHKKGHNPFDVDYILIKNIIDGSFLRFVPHGKKEFSYGIGDTVRVYSACSESELVKNNNIYTIPSYCFSTCILKNN